MQEAISGSGAAHSVQGAVMLKARQVAKIQGEAAVDLIESASAPRPSSPAQVGRTVDTYA